jgi:hypothetical protein
MDRHDQELLDRQLRRFQPAPRNNGVMILAITAVFFAGMTLGGFLFAYRSAPMRTASNTASPAISLLNGAPPIMRQ